MSIQFTAAVSSRMPVGEADDPLKKYWWAILGGFVLTGAWLCLPVMETSVGSTHVDASKPAVDPNSGANLDSLDNPDGAPGAALDLSMDGVGNRKSRSDEVIASMLYQAPTDAGAVAAGAPLGAASGSVNLAQQLKSVGAAKKRNEGGWTEKAQRGFASPRLAGSGVAGLGAVGGGGSSAVASAGVSAFGNRSAQIGFGSTRGLKDDGSGDEAVAGGGMKALRNAAKSAQAAAASHSNDAARAGMSGIFDGAKGQTASIGGPDGNSLGGAYEALDAAPANLKINDPKMDKKELKDPPATNVPSASSDNQMGKQLMMMAATAVIGGLIPGAGGQMVMMMGMMMMQQQQAQASEASSQKYQQAATNRMNGVTQ